MERQVVFGEWVRVDGAFTEWIKADAVFKEPVGRLWELGEPGFEWALNQIDEYIEQNKHSVSSIEIVRGWGARTTDPDTDWAVFFRKDNAEEWLDALGVE